MLGHDDGTLRYCAELTSSQLVHKMAEIIIILLLILHLLDAQLQLTLHLPQKHVIDEYVIILLIQFILQPDQLKPIPGLW